MAVDQREALIAAVRAQVEKERAEKAAKLQREQEAMAFAGKGKSKKPEETQKKYKTLTPEELAKIEERKRGRSHYSKDIQNNHQYKKKSLEKKFLHLRDLKQVLRVLRVRVSDQFLREDSILFLNRQAAWPAVSAEDSDQFLKADLVSTLKAIKLSITRLRAR